jgi:hypothetical protein
MFNDFNYTNLKDLADFLSTLFSIEDAIESIGLAKPRK